jgi:hypothetical protein
MSSRKQKSSCGHSARMVCPIDSKCSIEAIASNSTASLSGQQRSAVSEAPARRAASISPGSLRTMASSRRCWTGLVLTGAEYPA